MHCRNPLTPPGNGIVFLAMESFSDRSIDRALLPFELRMDIPVLPEDFFNDDENQEKRNEKYDIETLRGNFMSALDQYQAVEADASTSTVAIRFISHVAVYGCHVVLQAGNFLLAAAFIPTTEPFAQRLSENFKDAVHGQSCDSAWERLCNATQAIQCVVDEYPETQKILLKNKIFFYSDTSGRHLVDLRKHLMAVDCPAIPAYI